MTSDPITDFRNRLKKAEWILHRWERHDRDEDRNPDDQPRLSDEWEGLIRERDIFLSEVTKSDPLEEAQYLFEALEAVINDGHPDSRLRPDTIHKAHAALTRARGLGFDRGEADTHDRP